MGDQVEMRRLVSLKAHLARSVFCVITRRVIATF
jgi:hypothetical protein